MVLQTQVAEVRVKQVYMNNAETRKDGAFVLYLDAVSVVQEFIFWNQEMTINGQMVEMEHEEGTAWKSTGLHSGPLQLISKMHSVAQCSIFYIHLGRIPLGKVSVCFSFATLLSFENGHPVVKIPHSICKDVDASKQHAEESRVTFRGYSKKLKVSMQIVGRSPVHMLSFDGSNLESFNTQTCGKTATVELALHRLHLAQDLKMKIGMAQPLPLINVVLEQHDNTWAAMVSILPDSSEEDVDAEYIILLERSQGLTGEAGM